MHKITPILHFSPASHPEQSQGRWNTGRAPWRAQQGQGRVVLWTDGEPVPRPSRAQGRSGAGGCGELPPLRGMLSLHPPFTFLLERGVSGKYHERGATKCYQATLSGSGS